MPPQTSLALQGICVQDFADSSKILSYVLYIMSSIEPVFSVFSKTIFPLTSVAVTE